MRVIITLLCLLLLFITTVSFACQLEWDGKPLLYKLPRQNKVSLVAVEQPDIELLYVINEQQKTTILDTPISAGFTEVIKVGTDIVSHNSELCIYPKYQYTVDIKDYFSTLNIKFVPKNRWNEQLANATKLWSLGTEKDKRLSAKIYFDLFQSTSSTSDIQRYNAWLAALSAYKYLFDYDTVQILLSSVRHSDLSLKVWIKASLIEAEMALHNDDAIGAISKLKNIQNSTDNKEISLNEDVELHLLLSNAFFNNQQKIEGKRNLEYITSLLTQKNNLKKVDPRLLANYYDNYGHLHLTKYYNQKSNPQNELFIALEYEYQGLATATLSGVRSQKVSILSNIAWIYKSAGRFESAIRNYVAALSYIEEQEDKTDTFYIYRNLGMTYLSIGAYKKSLPYLEAVLNSSNGIPPAWSAKLKCLIGTAKRELGKILLAKKSHSECVSEFKKLKDNQDNLVNGLIEFSTTKATLNEHAEIHQIVQEIEQLVPSLKLPDTKVNALIWLAKYHQTEQKYSSIQALLDRAIIISQQVADPTLRVSASIEAALISITHDTADKSDYIDIAITNIEQTFSELNSEELGPAWSNRINNFYTTLIKNQIANNQFEQAFNLYERSRAVSLRKHKLINQKNEKLYPDKNTIKRLEKISSLSYDMLGSEVQSADALRLSVQTDLLSQNKLSNKNEPAIAELKWYQSNKKRLPKNHLNLAPPKNLIEIQSNLKDGQLVLAYFQSDQALYVFIVSSNHFSTHFLASSAEVFGLVDKVTKKLSVPNSNPWLELSELPSLLIPDVAYTLPTTEWIILPQDKLNRLPFSALLVNEGGSRKRPLIENVSITHVLSLSSFLQNETKNTKKNKFDMVMFGDPTMATPASSAENDFQKRSVIPFPAALPWSAFEADKLNLLYRNKRTHFFLKQEASRLNLLSKDVREADILHIATHSYYDKERPENVGFSLSQLDINGKKTSGYITFPELFTYEFRNQLVVINGCESALGEVLDGDGLQGMARGFLGSGAKNVIATLWPISDKASAKFMIQFHKNLIATKSIPKALQSTQKQISSIPRYRHPFYWAAYTLYSAN